MFISISRPLIRATACTALCVSCLPPAMASELFLPYVTHATGSWPEAVAIGDVNGDGLNDVVMTTSYYFDPDNDYKLFVFLQGANGQLQAPVKYTTQGSYGYRPLSVDVGDVNGDGKNDVVVGHSRAKIEVFLQSSGGVLASSAAIATENSSVVKIGDVNNDGRLDVVGVGHGTSTASVLYQAADGSLSAQVSFSAPHGGYDDLEIADVDDDAKNDVIIMSGQGYAYDNLAILTQNTAGGFNPASYYDLGLDVNSNGVGVGDLNGDGLNDVVVSYGGNSPSSKIGVFHQDAAVLAPAANHNSYDLPGAVEVGDVSDDGLKDVVVLHSGWNALGVYTQTTGGTLAAETLHAIPYTSTYNVQSMKLGDINNDGQSDVVIADVNQGLIVLEHQPATEPNNPPIANAGPDQLQQLGTTPLSVVLDGGLSSDPDNDPITYHWTLATPTGSSTLLDNPNIVNPVFTANVAGTYTASLQVSDGQALSAIDSVTIAVLPPNQMPVANAGTDSTVFQGSTVNLNGMQSYDPDGSISLWSWRQLSGPSVIINNSSSATASFVAPKIKGQRSMTLTFELTVTDTAGATATDQVKVTAVR